MKKNQTKIIKMLLINLVLATFFYGCSPRIYTTKYSSSSHVRLAQGVEASQTQGSITIELSPLDVVKEYEKSFYKSNFTITRKVFGSENLQTEPVEVRPNFFEKLSPFNVTIINNTPHILRMRDSRVFYIDPNSDEPVYAMDKQGIQGDLKTQIPNHKTLFELVQSSYPHTPPGSINSDITEAYTEILNQLRFISGFNMEIMPGMRTTGIIMFPVEPEKISQGTISFIDMVSKTDPAGNPAERVRFDYKTESFTRYWKTDPNSKELAEINRDEFRRGSSSPDKYTWDKNQRKWVKTAN